MRMYVNPTKLHISDEVYFAKVKPDAIIPSKRRADAGLDFYCCFEEDFMIIKPHETKLIPSGIASAFSEDWVLVFAERGSSGSKGISYRAGIIDSNFRSEIFMAITNTREETLVIIKDHVDKEEFKWKYSPYNDVYYYPYEKALLQALFLPSPNLTVKEISYEDLKKIESDRGEGMLGSSNK